MNNQRHAGCTLSIMHKRVYPYREDTPFFMTIERAQSEFTSQKKSPFSQENAQMPRPIVFPAFYPEGNQRRRHR